MKVDLTTLAIQFKAAHNLRQTFLFPSMRTRQMARLLALLDAVEALH